MIIDILVFGAIYLCCAAAGYYLGRTAGEQERGKIVSNFLEHLKQANSIIDGLNKELALAKRNDSPKDPATGKFAKPKGKK